MKVKNISIEDYVSLAEREESHFFDLKAKAVNGRSIQKAVVAFANADGGELIVGIRDKQEAEGPLDRWDGFTDIESMNSLLQAVFDIQPSANVQYDFFAIEEIEGYLLHINVEKSAEVLSTSDERIAVRQGAQSILLKDGSKIQALAFSKGGSTFEDSVLDDVPTELITESDEMSNFLKDFSPKTDPLDFVINQGLVDFTTWKVRVAATLLFHPNPSAAIPRKCAVKVSRYETREDEPEREHLAEQVTVEGPLYGAIHETVNVVTTMMSQVKVWTSAGIDKLDYPPEAIWETIVNSVIHRDYAISDDIQIFIFDNRIEIRSPGKLPGYVTVSNILEARYSRNPKIVRTLNRYKDAPNKDLGEGLNTTFQRMKDFGLKNPEIFEEGNYVCVRLPHTPLASPSEAILNFLQTHDNITNSQAREITGIKSENTVKSEFYKLRDAGFLEQVPELKGSKSAWRKKN